jgi:sugar lactone lactonase YvrE
MTFRQLGHHRAMTGESPLWDAERNCLWWIDIQAQWLLRTTIDGDTQAIAMPSQPGLIVLAQSGKLVIGLEDGLWLFSPETGVWQRLSDTESNRPSYRLNDGKADLNGRLWFGSMDMSGNREAEGRLYCRDLDGCISVVQQGVAIPNAIVPLTDGSGLTFCDTPTGLLRLLHTNSDGKIIKNEALHQFESGWHPDGACIDHQGHIWLAVIEPSLLVCLDMNGKVLQKWPAPVRRPTMPVFGGPKQNYLFLTSQRRFLGANALAEEPGAGGLYIKAVAENFASPTFRVAGL